MAQIKGITFDFGAATLVIPPIALGALEQLQQRITEFKGEVLDKAQVATVIDVAHAALLRNYPEMTRAQVADLIDVANMADVFQAVMDISGMRRKQAEAGEGQGN